MSELDFAPLDPLGLPATVLRAVNRILSVMGVSASTPTGPAVGPELPSRRQEQAHVSRRYTTLCGASGTDEDFPSRTALARSVSSTSIPFDDDEVDVVRVEGLRHAEMRLEAR
jgi:hypothetical protein